MVYTSTTANSSITTSNNCNNDKENILILTKTVIILKIKYKG